jgi:hypothetical protein
MEEAQQGSRRGPGRPRKETYSEDFPVTQPPEINASDLGFDPATRTPEVIVMDAAVAKELAMKDYMADLAFMEEFMTIFLYRGQEEYAPESYSFWVNGRQVDVPVETPVKLRRKYVEVIARSQPFKMRTVVIKPSEKAENGQIQNMWRREQSAAYPFHVVEDKNPRGVVWLESCKRQN